MEFKILGPLQKSSICFFPSIRDRKQGLSMRGRARRVSEKGVFDEYLINISANYIRP